MLCFRPILYRERKCGTNLPVVTSENIQSIFVADHSVLAAPVHIIIIIISGFVIYGAAVVPDSGVGNTSHSFSMNFCLTG